MTQRAKVIGRMIAAGKLNPNASVTWGDLCAVEDIAEGTDHGKARRAELEAEGVLAPLAKGKKK